MDYFMFEGVERFSSFPENINLRIVCAIEVFYVIMSNFIIYSTFYGDFKLPIKVIIQFSALNLISVIVAMVLLVVIENPMCYLTTIFALHVVSTAEKKIGEKTKNQRSAESNFVFENAAEELMFPGENELNTISDIASEDECDLNLDDEIEIAQQEEAIASVPASSREPSIFATAESGRPRRHEHRIQIMQRTLNRVASIECYHPSTVER
ncbi:hypothetical protein B9Z55_020446 [Caenorhabditis nigoni]|uniref:Uncharacterized protein n=1 Tax=Caenorhabditis nigoni TaxID=1611254 RepID=A0A2G5TMV4_9PELO|nr:hypothetical protein B9Z55_020446 [Caenorhabditis nigoni]